MGGSGNASSIVKYIQATGETFRLVVRGISGRVKSDTGVGYHLD